MLISYKVPGWGHNLRESGRSNSADGLPLGDDMISAIIRATDAFRALGEVLGAGTLGWRKDEIMRREIMRRVAYWCWQVVRYLAGVETGIALALLVGRP